MSKRRAFSLPEALVMILMAGSLMVPIIGTMLKSASDTTNLKHQRMSREVALSAKAAILQGAPYPGLPRTDFPLETPTGDGATLSVTVTFSQVREFETLGPAQDRDDVRRPAGLYAFRIDVERLAAPTAGFDAASMTFLTGLVHSRQMFREMIFTSSVALQRVAAIDILTNTVSYVNLPGRDPEDLAVHPSNRFLYVQCATGVAAVCIDPASSSYLREVGFAPGGVGMTAGSGDNAREDLGLDLRLDGKYLFAFNTSDQYVYSYALATVAPFITYTGVRFDAGGVCFPFGTKGKGVKCGSDNELYIAGHSASHLFRTFVGGAAATASWNATGPHGLGGVAFTGHGFDIRPDGQLLLQAEHSTGIHPLEPLFGNPVGTVVSTGNYAEGITFSRNGRLALVCDKGASTLMYYLRNCATFPGTLVSQNINPAGTANYFPTVPPDNQNVYFTTYSDYVEYLNLASMTSGAYGANLNPVPRIDLAAGFNPVNIASRKFPQIVVGTSDGANHQLDVIDGGAGRIWKSLPLPNRPDFLEVFRLGDVVYSGQLGSETIVKTDLYQTGPTWQTTANPFAGGDTARGLAIASDTVFVAGTRKQADRIETDLAALGGLTVRNWAAPHLNEASFTVPFHHQDLVLTAFAPNGGNRGGLRISSASANAWEYPASQPTELNWPNHPVGAIALSPDDGLLAVHRFDTDPQSVEIYDLGGAWPPRNPTWGRFAYQKFAWSCGHAIGGGSAPAGNCPFESTNTFQGMNASATAWFSPATDQFYSLRRFAEFNFGGQSYQIRTGAGDGCRVAVQNQAGPLALAGFDDPGLPFGAGTGDGWQRSSGEDYRSGNLAGLPAWGKLWEEWYNSAGNTDDFLAVYRVGNATSYYFDGASVPPASYGFNLYSQPVRLRTIPVSYADASSLSQAAGQDQVRLCWSRNGEWLFVLDRANDRVKAVHLLQRTLPAVADKEWVRPAGDAGFDLVDLCTSIDGGQLWVTSSSGTAGKSYGFSCSDEQSPEFFTVQETVEHALAPVSIGTSPLVNPRHRCRRVGEIPVPINFARAVAFQGKIYLLGGKDAGGTATTTVLVYDPLTNAFSASLALPAAVAQGGAVVLDDMIIHLGGAGAALVNQTFRFWPNGGDATFVDIGSDYSKVVAGGVRSHSLAALDGFVYSFGGWGVADVLSIGSLGFPGSGGGMSGWVPVAIGVFTGATHLGEAVAGDDKIYFIGGYRVAPPAGTKNTILQFDPKTGGLSILAPSPAMTPRCLEMACQFQGKIYIFGGCTDNTSAASLSSVECYDPATNRLTTLPDLPVPIGAAGIAVVGGKAYLLGGRSNGTVLNTIYEYEL